jgi:hypothetical protein
MRCSKIQENKMQCQRQAELVKSDNSDPENREALCKVCFLLSHSPAGYKELRPAKEIIGV